MDRNILITGDAGFIGSGPASASLPAVWISELVASPAPLRALEQHPRNQFVRATWRIRLWSECSLLAWPVTFTNWSASSSSDELACQQGAWANIPPKRNRKDPICFSPYLYRARNLIERFFNKIKQCRRVATRYDKLAANYLAFVKLASIRIWLRANEFTA